MLIVDTRENKITHVVQLSAAITNWSSNVGPYSADEVT